jgi:hypothetical protein
MINSPTLRSSGTATELELFGSSDYSSEDRLFSAVEGGGEDRAIARKLHPWAAQDPHLVETLHA